MINRNLAAVFLAILLAASQFAGAETPDPTSYHWTEEFAGQPLDLAGYELAFNEDFDEQVLTNGSGKGPWYAPIHADYGVAVFDLPDATNETYLIADGMLRIRATLDEEGVWHGGNVQTVTYKGVGFAQRYGYFETRMRLGGGPAAWAAFWLKSQHDSVDYSAIKTEIDVLEWYGGDPTGHHRSVHLRPAADEEFRTPGRLQSHWYESNFSRHSDLEGVWHTHGVLITPELTTIYMDRRELARFPTLDEFKVPLYMLLSLTIHKMRAPLAVPPIDLEIDYVRTYTMPIPRPPEILDIRISAYE